MLDRLDIVLAGVGGQGTLVAGKLLGQVAAKMGLDVRVSEVHGMAQRGGSVVTYVRMAPEVFAPVAEAGSVQAILAFEELEALRWAHVLARDGLLLVNREKIMPLPVGLGQAKYPQDIVGQLTAALGSSATIKSVNAAQLAVQAGSSRAVNTVMLGAMAAFFGLPDQYFTEAIDFVFAKKLCAVNHEAYRLGSAIMK